MEFIDKTKINHKKILDCEKGYSELPEVIKKKIDRKPQLECEGKKHVENFAEKYAKKNKGRIK
jgi:hypothetical protein